MVTDPSRPLRFMSYLALSVSALVLISSCDSAGTSREVTLRVKGMGKVLGIT